MMMWGYGYPLHGFGYGAGWLGMGAMMFFGLIVTVAAIALVVWLLRGPARNRAPYQYGTVSACEVAKVRYASGEITKEQYQEICRAVWR